MKQSKKLKKQAKRVIKMLKKIDGQNRKKSTMKAHKIDKYLPKKNTERVTWRPPSDVYSAISAIAKVKGTSVNALLNSAARLVIEELGGQKKFKLKEKRG